MSRVTAYERVFADPQFEDELFPAVRAEADARGAETADPGAFMMLAATADLLDALRPEPGPEPAGAEPVMRYGAVAYHGYNQWLAGRPAWRVSRAALEALLAAPPRVGQWTLAAPAAAGALLLPERLFWVPGTADRAAEPLDELSWVHATDAPLRLLLVLGLRPDRPGFTMVDLEAPLPPPPARHWADISARDGADFENVLPGGELAGFRSVVNAAEALKLLSYIFWVIERHPETVRAERDESGRTMHVLDVWDAAG